MRNGRPLAAVVIRLATPLLLACRVTPGAPAPPGPDAPMGQAADSRPAPLPPPRLARCVSPGVACATAGCLTDITTDPLDCGGCASDDPIHRCGLPADGSADNHAFPTCRGGVCGIACAAGYLDCDGPDNGCEVDLARDSHNCGACGHACADLVEHGRELCQGGVCSLRCAAGWADCSSTIPGCEQDTSNSLPHCGGCGNRCQPFHGAATCEAGRCRLTCENGFADCDDRGDNGCETNLRGDPAHCGACATACAGGQPCQGGACGQGGVGG